MLQYHFGDLTTMSARANRKRRKEMGGGCPTSPCQPHSLHTTRGHEHHSCLSHGPRAAQHLHLSKWQPAAVPFLHPLPSSQSQPLTMAATLSSVAAPSLPKHIPVTRAQQQAPPSIISASTVSRDAAFISVVCFL
jgi:hypothetical protein